MKPVKITLIALTLLLGTNLRSNAQLLPTNLKVTVLDELGNPVEKATVILYNSKDNYLNSSSAVASASTNAKGMVKFKKLEARAYYIEATKGDMKNDGLGAETEALTAKKTNKVNVVIE